MLHKGTSLVATDLDRYLAADNPIGANSEFDLINAWLQHCASNSKNTYDSYLKEVKRLCIFCESIGTHFTQITALEINEYLGILKDPPPHWLKDNKSTVNRSTQILYKPLAINSVEYAQTVLKNFYGYLQNAGVISTNPVNLSVKIKADTPYDQAAKALSFAAWDYLSAWLKHESERANHKNRSKAIRDRWLMHLLYHSGARRGSIFDLTMNAFKIRDKGQYRVWTFEFIQKGNRTHEVIATDELIDEWSYYRKAIGLPSFPTGDEDHIPLVTAVSKNPSSILKSTNSISTRGINYVISECLELAARDCEDYFISEELKNTTCHTFRHTNATHRLRLGADLVSTQNHLGHKSINTTMIYLKDTQEHQVENTQILNQNLKKRGNSL